jgi:Flp pilus assembly pilin Flp
VSQTRYRPWLPDQAGLTTVEYVIVLCLIAAVAVASWQIFGDHVLGWLEQAGVKLQDNLTDTRKEPPANGAN